jgi:hypothetical protein
MSEDRTYHIDLKLGLEFVGEDIPDEEILITPVKAFIKNHIKTYKKTTRIVVIDSRIREAGYEEIEEDES